MRHFDTPCGKRCAYHYMGGAIFALGGVGSHDDHADSNREYNHDISIAIRESNHDMHRPPYRE